MADNVKFRLLVLVLAATVFVLILFSTFDSRWVRYEYSMKILMDQHIQGLPPSITSTSTVNQGLWLMKICTKANGIQTCVAIYMGQLNVTQAKEQNPSKFIQFRQFSCLKYVCTYK